MSVARHEIGEDAHADVVETSAGSVWPFAHFGEIFWSIWQQEETEKVLISTTQRFSWTMKYAMID